MEIRPVIGTKRLERIARTIGANKAGTPCRGRFVLEAQRQLYGSRASPLRKVELQEVIAYLERRMRTNNAADKLA